MADENGSTEPLRAYKEKTLVIVLPGDLTVFDIGMKERKKDEIIVMLLHFFLFQNGYQYGASLSLWILDMCRSQKISIFHPV